MAAAFGDPLTVSRHEIPQKTSSSFLPVQLSYSTGAKSEYVDIGVQGDGINIIDLNSLQPDAAALLGPGCIFACAPVSRTVQNDRQQHIRQTYAATYTSQGSKPLSKCNTIHSWLSSEGIAALEKQDAITLEHSIFALYAPQWSTNVVIALSPEGWTTLCDSNLQLIYQEPASPRPRTVLFSFLFSGSECRFAPSSSRSSVNRPAILLTLFKHRGEIDARLTVVSDSIDHVDEVRLNTTSPSIVDATCDKQGCLSLLGSDGVISSFILEMHQSKLSITSLDDMELAGLNITATSILCLGSTHVAVSGLSQSDQNIVLLLWDVQYSVLLTERKTSLPAVLSALPLEQQSLRLVTGNESHAILGLCPRNTQKKSIPQGVKAVVLAIPFTIPPESSLANVIGRAEDGKKWLRLPAQDAEHDQDMLDSPLSLSNDQYEMSHRCVNALREGRIEEADKIFFDWIAETRAALVALAKEEVQKIEAFKLKQSKPVNGVSGDEAAAAVDSDHSMEEKPNYSSNVRPKYVSKHVHLDHQVVAQLVNAILPADSVDKAYSFKIILYLFEQNMISDSMLPEGVLNMLRQLKNWDAIKAALKSTIDVPEDSLILLLRDTIHLARGKPDKPGESMDVDPPAEFGVPAQPTSQASALPTKQVLGHIMSYPTSAPSLRLAIRQHLTDMDDVTALLDLIDEMTKKSVGKSLNVILADPSKPGKDPNKEKGMGKDGVPRLELIILFLSCVLDATLLNLLQYPPAHPILRNICNRLNGPLGYLDDVEKIRGPLEPFVHAQRHASRPRHEQHRNKGHDYRHRERASNSADNHSLAIDLYQVEEFWI